MGDLHMAYQTDRPQRSFFLILQEDLAIHYAIY